MQAEGGDRDENKTAERHRQAVFFRVYTEVRETVASHSAACPRRNSRHQPTLLRSLDWHHRSDDTNVRDVSYVTFPCGYTVGADGDAINPDYGAADTSVALATGSITQLLDWLDRHGTAA